MAWTRLTNSTTADADEVHANFVEIRSGSLLPMKLSTSASTTDGAYDIGSSTKAWRKLYVGSISADYISRVQNLIFSINTNSSAIAPSDGITITSLNSDNVSEYILHARISTKVQPTTTANTIDIYFNGDSSTNYVSAFSRDFAYIFNNTIRSGFQCCARTSTVQSGVTGSAEWIGIVRINPMQSYRTFAKSDGVYIKRGDTFDGSTSSQQIVSGYCAWRSTATITSMLLKSSETITSYDIKVFAIYN